MPKALFVLAFLIAASIPAAAQDARLEAIQYASLAAEIARPQAPNVRGRHVIFTAPGNARHVGIAFEHEGYSIVHDFRRLVPREGGAMPEEATLFYIMEIPPETAQVRYRIVRDGLWMADPLNPQSVYDFRTGTRVSVLQVEPYKIYRTASAGGNVVRFVYEGESGEVIRVAGSFNNWDPFMYEMTEFERGKYELYLPLPRGTWHYAFFNGTTQIRDESASLKVYTKDGRVASVITVE